MYGCGPATGCMSLITEERRDARLDLRMTSENRALINEAADLNGTSLTD